MVSKTKLYLQLDSLEAELKEKLIPLLEHAANGGDDLIFCVEAFNLFPQLKHSTNHETEALVDLSAQILALKSKLGEPSEGSIAERICWYCREWGNLEKHHKRSAPGLARQFLEEIDKNLL